MSHSGKENMQFINILTQETENRVICAWRWTLSSCKNSPPLMTKPLLDLSRGKLGDILINFLSRARGNLQPSKCFWTSQKKNSLSLAWANHQLSKCFWISWIFLGWFFLQFFSHYFVLDFSSTLSFWLQPSKCCLSKSSWIVCERRRPTPLCISNWPRTKSAQG